MKVKYKLTACIFGLLFLITFLNISSAKAQYDDDVSLETFYEELSPYGIWIDDPQYGMVWRPDVDQDEFRPYYSRGHWEMTNFGNTWISDYDWGWAPFHYGRWHHAGRRGWLWIPGTQWGPAWVSWRSGVGHYGWAPLGPGINLHISTLRIPDFYWVFVPQRSIYYSSYPRYNSQRNVNIYHNTVIINNAYLYNRNKYYTGPQAEEIRRVTRQPVTIHNVRNQRPDHYNGRPVVNRAPERSDNSVQSPRPQRPDDNSAGRGATSGRTGNSISEKPAEHIANRPGQNQFPASSQRSDRTYDNQDIRGSRSAQGQHPEIMERPQTNRPSAPQREQKTERPAQGEVSHNNSGQQNAGQNRGSSSEEKGTERSSSTGIRPARVQ